MNGDVPSVPVTTLSGLATLTQREYYPTSPQSRHSVTLYSTLVQRLMGNSFTIEC